MSFEKGLTVSVGDTGDQASSNERSEGPSIGLTSDVGVATESNVEVEEFHSIGGQKGLSSSARIGVVASISKRWLTPESSGR